MAAVPDASQLSSMTTSDLEEEQLKWSTVYLQLCTISEDTLKQHQAQYAYFLRIEAYTEKLEKELTRRSKKPQTM